MQDTDALSTLDWLLAAGADEAIGEIAVNRLISAAVRPPPAEQPRPAKPQERSAPRPVRPTAEMTGPGANDAKAAAAAAMSLPELRAALEAFDGVGLKRAATHTVFADGIAGASVMLIGEAPGRDEDRIGKPFVGKAGQLLDKMLACIGLNRDTNCYITNVINWRPPDNRDPTPEEVAMCLPFLRRHIELASPKLLVLLGAVAAKHVMGITDGIMRARGRWMEYRIGDAMVPIIPTLHPAYLLRQPAHKNLAWRDLQAIAARMEGLGLTAEKGAGGI